MPPSLLYLRQFRMNVRSASRLRAAKLRDCRILRWRHYDPRLANTSGWCAPIS